MGYGVGRKIGLVIPTCFSALLSFFPAPFSNLAPHGAKSMHEHFDTIRCCRVSH